MTSGLTWDAGGFSSGLRTMRRRVDDATRAAVGDGIHLIQRQAQQNSSGRPGPNVVTGAHRRGIVVIGPRPVGSGWEAFCGPTMVYSRVLENRYPYLGPAMDWARRGPIAATFARHWAGL